MALCLQFLLAFKLAHSQKLEKYKVFPTEDKIIFDIGFSDNGEVLAVADNTTIKVFSTESQQLIADFPSAHSDRILAVDISEDSTLLVSGGRDGTIVIWDFIERSTLQSISLDDAVVTSLDISPNSKYIVAGSSKGETLVYDIENNVSLFNLNDHKKDITSVKIGPNGNLFATASGDKTINIYELANGKQIQSLKGHKNWVRDISFSSDSKTLLSCGDDSQIIKWDLSELDSISSRVLKKGIIQWFTSIDYVSNQNTFLFGGINGDLIVSTSLGKYKAKLTNPINRAQFLPNPGNFIKVVVATSGKGVLLVEAEEMAASFN